MKVELWLQLWSCFPSCIWLSWDQNEFALNLFISYGSKNKCLSPTQIRNYSDCACVQSRQVITPSGGNHELQVVIVKTYLNENGYALAGKCERTCGTLLTFLIFLFIVTLITACGQPSVIIVTLRSVSLYVLSRSFFLPYSFSLFEQVGGWGGQAFCSRNAVRSSQDSR